MKVVIVGAGNTATVLSLLIHNAHHSIVQVVSRNTDHAAILANKYHTSYTSLFEEKFEEADLYIIALSDEGLTQIDKIKALKNKLVVHTAGAVAMNILNKVSKRFGVLYPLQTLSKSSKIIPEIPFLVNGNTPATLQNIQNFAKSISLDVRVADDVERLHYHIAAVFVSNFTNHILALGELFCKKEGLSFKALLPLINEVNRKANEESPLESQTGPAIRNDVSTMKLHVETLNDYPQLQEIYKILSKSIYQLDKK
jgi:predicted short-subunit dehydrogenase-like oxidoreductase (DUF2520 family)